LTDYSLSDDGTEASGATKINNFASSELFDTDKPQKALGKIRFIMHHIDESIQNMMSKFDDKGNYIGGTRTRQYTRQNKRHRRNKRSRRQ
jgi:hypothetical protein